MMTSVCDIWTKYRNLSLNFFPWFSAPVVDDDEKELRELEAERAAERQSGGLQNLLTMTQPGGNALSAGQLAPLPSNDALFGKSDNFPKIYSESWSLGEHL